MAVQPGKDGLEGCKEGRECVKRPFQRMHSRHIRGTTSCACGLREERQVASAPGGRWLHTQCAHFEVEPSGTANKPGSGTGLGTRAASTSAA